MRAPDCHSHPAAEWAAETTFNTIDVDCTITVVLKILDGKCKMLAGEKAAILEIYDVVQMNASTLFDAAVHQTIDKARHSPDASVLENIHAIRLFAEENIPKPVMKRYKAKLREGLFG